MGYCTSPSQVREYVRVCLSLTHQHTAAHTGGPLFSTRFSRAVPPDAGERREWRRRWATRWGPRIAQNPRRVVLPPPRNRLGSSETALGVMVERKLSGAGAHSVLAPGPALREGGRWPTQGGDAASLGGGQASCPLHVNTQAPLVPPPPPRLLLWPRQPGSSLLRCPLSSLCPSVGCCLHFSPATSSESYLHGQASPRAGTSVVSVSCVSLRASGRRDRAAPGPSFPARSSGAFLS